MQKKIKLLLMSPIPPPVGGIAIWTEKILQYYKLNESVFDISHLNTALEKRRITDKSLISRIRFGILDFFSLRRKLNLHFNKADFSLAHITSSASLALVKDYFIVKLLKNKGVRVIIHFRFGRIPFLYEKKNWEWKLLLKVCSLCDTIIVLDSASRDVLLNEKFINVELLANPISEREIEMFIPNEDKFDNSLLFVGHVTKNKGIFDLIHATVDIEKVKKVKLIGPYEDEVYTQLRDIESKNNRSDFIEFLGVLKKEEILKEMRRCTIFVLPSFTEGFPNVVLEAMSQSCLVIATEVGAIPDMLSDNCGLCVPVNNISILKDSIESHIDDKEGQLRIGKNARNKVITQYSMNSIIEKMEKIWLNTL